MAPHGWQEPWAGEESHPKHYLFKSEESGQQKWWGTGKPREALGLNPRNSRDRLLGDAGSGSVPRRKQPSSEKKPNLREFHSQSHREHSSPGHAQPETERHQPTTGHSPVKPPSLTSVTCTQVPARARGRPSADRPHSRRAWTDTTGVLGAPCKHLPKTRGRLTRHCRAPSSTAQLRGRGTWLQGCLHAYSHTCMAPGTPRGPVTSAWPPLLQGKKGPREPSSPLNPPTQAWGISSLSHCFPHVNLITFSYLAMLFHKPRTPL